MRGRAEPCMLFQSSPGVIKAFCEEEILAAVHTVWVDDGVNPLSGSVTLCLCYLLL